MQNEQSDQKDAGPAQAKRRPGRPPGNKPPLTPTERARAFRRAKFNSGGSELSVFLSKPATVAIDIIRTAKGPYKVSAVEHALVKEAMRTAPDKEAVNALLASGSVSPEVAQSWIEFLSRAEATEGDA